MNVSSLEWWDKIWFFLRSRPFTLLGGLLLIVAAVPFCRRHDSEWEQVYVRAAANLWNGEQIYRLQDAYLYPPFMAFTALPFLPLSAWMSRLLWFAINTVCLLVMLRLSWQTAGGGCLKRAADLSGRERLAAILGGICGISYLQNCLAHQQTDIVLGAMLGGGCLLLTRGRTYLAATWFGLAAACKCTALLWIPYLLWRGRPFASVWVLLVAIVANLLPNIISTDPNGKLWLQTYTSDYLLPLTDSNRYVGSWGSDPIYNQSLAGLGHRWCTTVFSWSAKDGTVKQCSPLLTPDSLRVCIYSSILFLLGIVLWVCGRPFRALSKYDNDNLLPLECGMVLLLMLLLSPMSSKAHFGTVILPGFILARTALFTRARAIQAITIISVFLGLLGNKDPLGEKLYTLTLWYGVVTWQTLVLLLGCLLIYHREKARTTERVAYRRYSLGGLFGSRKYLRFGDSKAIAASNEPPVTLFSD
jgi:hypothetical protein